MSDKENEILLNLKLETDNTALKLSEIKESFSNLGKVVNSLPSFFTNLTNAVTLSIDNFKKNTSSIDNFVNAINNSNTKLKESSKTLNSNSNELKNNNTEIQKNTSVLQQQNQSINQNINSLKTEKIGLQENTIEFQRKNEIITVSLNAYKAESAEIKNKIAVLQLEKQAISGTSKEIKEQKALKDESILALKNEKVGIEQKINVLTKAKNINNEHIQSIALRNKELQNNISLTNIQKNSISSQISEEEKLKKALNEANKELTKQNKVLSETPQEVKKTQTAYETLIERVKAITIGSLISSMVRNALNDIKTLFNTATDEFIQFDRNIQKIRGLTQDNPQSYNTIEGVVRKSAEKVGSRTGSESENIQEIVTAGVTDLTEATKVYEQSLILARTSVSATKTEQQALNEVISSGVIIMNNYNLKASELPTVFNQMAVASNKSKLDISAFASKIGGLASTFAPTGIALNELMSIFAIFSNKLKNENEADVALRAIAKKFLSPTQAFRKEMVELQKMTKGELIDLTPSELRLKGFMGFAKNLINEMSKTAEPENVAAKMLGLQQATKGFQDLALSIKQGDIDKLTNESLTKVDTLRIQYEYIIQSLSSKLEIFKNSFIRLFTNIFKYNEQTISDTFDKLIDFLNVSIGLASQLINIFTLGLGIDQIKALLEPIKPFLDILMYGIEGLIKLVSLLSTTTFGFIEMFGLAVGAFTKRLFLLAGSVGNFWNYFWDPSEFEKNKQTIQKQWDDVADIFNDRMAEIQKNSKEKLSNLFDLNKYATVTPQIYLDKKAVNYAEEAKKKELKPPVTMVGSGEFDFNSKLAQEAMDQIEKENLSKKEYKLKKAKDKYKADLLKSQAEYDKVKLLVPADIERLTTDLNNPEKSAIEKEAIQKDIDILNQKSLNNEANFGKAKIALLKRFQAEEKNINAEILKEKQDAIKKAETEYKKKIDDKYQPLINDQKTAINRVDIDNQDKSEIQRLELKNVQLFKLMALQQEYSGKFKQGSQERSAILKQNSITDLEALDNEKKINKLKQQDRLENAKISYSAEKNLIKRQASENNFNKDVELNNQNFLDSKRIEKLKASLSSEKNLTFEQKKTLNKDIQDLEQSILDNDLEMSKIRKQRAIENTFFEIDQEKIKFNLLVEMGQESNRAQLENDIETNNKMIAEYERQISLLDKIKSSDEIDNLNKKIKPLANANELDKFKINELAYKLQKEQDDKNFSDKQKSLELFRNLQIYSEETLSQELIKINDEKLKALENQEKIFIATYGTDPINEAKKQELEQLKESILDTNNFILLESKKLTEAIYQEEKRKLDIQIGFLDNYSSAFSKFGESLKNTNNDVFSLISSSFNSLSENYNKAISIFKQIEPIQKQISDNKARQNTIKPLLNDEIEKYKQTGIPTTKLSNLLNENNKLESDNKTSNQQADMVGVMSAVEQVSNMIFKGVEAFNKQDEATKKLSQTYQLFGKDSKEVALAQSEVFESSLEIIKVLPGVGDMLYKAVRLLTDFTGVTKTEKEKKDLKDLEQATLSYAKTKLSATSNYHETKLEMIGIEKQEELKALKDMNLNDEAFRKKEAEIQFKAHQKLIQENRDYYTQLNDLRNQNRLLDLQDINSDGNSNFKAKLDYIKELDSIMKDFNLSYRKMINSSDEIVKQRLLNADKKWTNDKNKIELNRAETTISIQKETEKERVNLWEDSLTKKYQLAFIDYQNQKELALKDRSSGKLDQEQYLATLNLIELKYQGVKQSIQKEANDKLRGINEKNYNEELKAFESLNKNKTDKLKSDLQKQFDIINEFEQKKKDLLESREQDQALKIKRKNQLEIDLAKKKNDLLNNGAFYEQNSTNFDVGNGLTTGNDTIRKNVDNQFELGLITYQERNEKRQQLALEKQLYYQALLSKYKNPQKQAEINNKIQEASKEYYEFIFDKEQEKLDIEKKDAEKKIALFQKELSEREKIESDYITMLDNKYKDSAGLYKTAFIDASRDWIAYARQETIQKLGIDTFNQLQKTANNLNDNKIEAQKYLGNNPTTSSIPNTSSSNVSLPNNQQTNSTQNNNNANTAANTNNGFVYGPFDRPKDVVIPIQVQATEKIDQTDPLRRKILDGIYKQSSFLYDIYYPKSTNELIAYAERNNIPMYAKGGVTRGASLVGEKGSEAVFNASQMQGMYDFVLKNTSSNNVNNNSNINLNLTIHAQSSDNKNLANQISNEVNKSFKTLTNTLSIGKK